MKKKRLLMLIGLIMILTACSEEKSTMNVEDAKKEVVSNVPESIDKITVTGYDPAIFTEDEEHPQKRNVLFKKEQEIELFLNAIKDSTVPSGEVTSEAENFKIILSDQDGNSDTILLWLYPDKNLGRIQKENYDNQVRILRKDDVQILVELLKEKSKTI
ncbi:hypothetical protein [Radiobacillus deserti]|uniref:Lipoprotein n=1 Tax=Radiobacillus deserti TaxID=2594883 RepID=A0A516KIH0_9BACI|nr:hypothetical protein [Radiobacillus deserti]QDP41146.1 hypothetical protein FN924_13670 [Radiobacillus deserti]